MNTIQDAYQPPIHPTKKSSLWLRLSILSIALACAVGLACYSAMRIREDVMRREMNSSRRPAREYLETNRVPVRDLNPNPIPDGSGN